MCIRDSGDTVTITVKPDDGFKLDDLTVTDKNGNELKLTDKGNGDVYKRQGHSEPLTVLPKIALGEYPYFEEFSKNFLRSRRMRSLRLMTARWLTPILWAYSLSLIHI